MIIWFISIAGVIGGVIAIETSITDPKAELTLGIVLMGGAIHFTMQVG